jgi:hypothetical protein
MAQSTFQGPVRSLSGFISQGPNAVATISTATATLDVANYAGKIIRVTAATSTITLPAVNASANPVSSGPGQDPNTLNNLGASFTFFLPATATAVKIITGAGDFLEGQIITGVSAAATAGSVVMYAADGTTHRSINLNGTTTGGIGGSYFTVIPVTANTYMVYGNLIGSGTLATPFATS